MFTSSGFDFRVQGKQVVTPLTAPVHTKPETIPSVNRVQARVKTSREKEKGRKEEKNRKRKRPNLKRLKSLSMFKTNKFPGNGAKNLLS